MLEYKSRGHVISALENEQKHNKPQLPVNDLCIFVTTRLARGTNTFIVCLTAFPSCLRLLPYVASPHSSADGEASQIPKQTSESVLRLLFRVFVSKATHSWGPRPWPCIMHHMVHKQYAKIFFFSQGDTILQCLINNSEATSQSLTYGVFLLGSFRNMR